MKSLFQRNERVTTPITENFHVVVQGDEDTYGLKPSTQGMLLSTWITFIYFLRPIHLAIPAFMIFWSNLLLVRWLGYLIVVVCLVSFCISTHESPAVVRRLFPSLLEYFHYDEIAENSPINIQESIRDGKQYIYACQPHGIVPFCSLAWSVRQAQIHEGPRHSTIIPTAVASLVLWTPILKHLVGLFGSVTASEMKRRLAKKETSCVRLYVGSTTEIFYCNELVEVVQLTKRKKFIQVALQMGVDVIPVYMFGNSQCFSQWNHPWLIKISQWLQFPVTYSWGRFGLPIPRAQKLLYVAGQPLEMPQLRKPRPAQIEFWHKKYCEEVERLFDQYKERVPAYKNKKLVIV